MRPFTPPPERWASGHRGVDLAAPTGTPVTAPAAGVVSFVGVIAGRPVMVVSHGELRSTFEPVRATVREGTEVTAGQQVGVLETGHDCPAASCLHWGLKRDDEYLDPLSLLSGSSVRLLPGSAVAEVRNRALARAVAAGFDESGVGRAGTSGGRSTSTGASGGLPGAGASGSGRLLRPTNGRLGSRFGPRFHPIFHEWRPHQGIDLSSPCGTPIRAAESGVVTHMGFDSSGGWRLVINHGGGLSTVYLHATGYQVRSGQRVSRGETVGWVGSTGWSTGCHLHFSVKVDGRHVDPLQYF